ncbi:oxidoreductase FAD/NAD(P)-binding domain protein, partial [mine drainage metagenome]
PFFSMLRQAEAMGKKLDCSMIYSVKYPYDIIEKQELDKFSTDMELKALVTVTRPAEGDGWTGQTGRVNGEMIKKAVPDFMDRVAYICGPPEFVKALKDDLVAMGMNDREIRAEMWG